MFHKHAKLKTEHKITFAIVIGFAVVAFWRGVWGLLDVYLFPDNPSLSLWLSALLGIAILVITGYLSKELM